MSGNRRKLDYNLYMKPIKLAQKMREVKTPLPHNTSGFGPVILFNGYEEHESPYGKGIAYEDIDGMVYAILLARILRGKDFTDKEKAHIKELLIPMCNGWTSLDSVK